MSAILGLNLASPMRNAHGVPLVVEVFDHNMSRVAAVALPVGRRHALPLPSGGRATILVHTPLGNTLTSGIDVSAGVTIDHDVDITPFGCPRPALTALVRPRTSLTEPPALWIRIWSRSEPGAPWQTVQPLVLTTGESSALRVRSKGLPEDGTNLVQFGGPTTAWRITAIPPGNTVDALVHARIAGELVEPAVAIIGAEPGADALMAYLTLGRLEHAALVANLLRGDPRPQARLAYSYWELLDPQRARPADGPPPPDTAASADWSIVRATQLAREPVVRRNDVRTLAAQACREFPPLWTIGLTLLAALVRNIGRWPDGLGSNLSAAWEDIRPLLSCADLTAPTVTFPAASPTEPAAVPVTGFPSDALALPSEFGIPTAGSRGRRLNAPLAPSSRSKDAIRLPDPPPRPRLAANSPTDEPLPVFVVATPHGDIELITGYNLVDRSYELTVKAATGRSAILPVEFTTLDGRSRTIWLPLAIEGSRPARARVDLVDRDPSQPVYADQAVPVDHVTVWDAAILRASTNAALDHGTRTAWLRVLRLAGPDVAALLDSDLLQASIETIYPPDEHPRPALEVLDAMDALLDALPQLVPPTQVRYDDGTVQRWSHPSDLLDIRIREGDDDTTHLELQAPPILDGTLIQVDCGPPEVLRRYLVPLNPDGHGDLSLPMSLAASSVKIVDIMASAGLDHRHADAVVSSVRACTPTGLAAWRHIARTRLFGDPIRSAVVEGLRSLI